MNKLILYKRFVSPILLDLSIDPFHDPGSGSGPVGAIRVGEYKLIKGRPGRPDGWIPPDHVTNDIQGFSLPANLTPGRSNQVDSGRY